MHLFIIYDLIYNTDEATVLNRTIYHSAWAFVLNVVLSVPW